METKKATATKPAAQVWRWLFEEPWPKSWRVEWVEGYMQSFRGLTIHAEKRVLLSWGDFGKTGNPFPTLVHEFLHMRGFHHSKEFREREMGLRERLSCLGGVKL